VYDVILADPPWFYNSRKGSYESFKDKRESKNGTGRTKFGGGAEGHYPLMKNDELLALKPQVDRWANSNCVLFLWATCPKLGNAIEILKGWGFRYCTVAFTWVKISRESGEPVAHPGYYTASNVELCLAGCRGSMRPDTPMIRQVVMSPRMEHSRKPDEVRSRIELMYPAAKRLEMFARQRYVGWDCWGLEVEESQCVLAT